jgi:hypothetical protein
VHFDIEYDALKCVQYYEIKLNTQIKCVGKIQKFCVSKPAIRLLYTDTNAVLAVTDATPFTKHMHSLNIRSAGV